MKKKITAALSVCLSLALVGCGAPPDDENISEAQIHQRVSKGLDRVLGKLDATETQKVKVRAMAKDLIQKGRKVKATHKVTRDKLKAQWNSPRPDRQAVHKIVDTQLDVMKGFIHQVVDKVVDLHAVLTPQQRQELQQLGKKFHEHRRGHGFFRHGPGH